MEFVEIIHLRSAQGNRKVKQLLSELLKETKTDKRLVRIGIFSNAKLNTDVSIHLHWHLDRPLQQESEPGSRLVHMLKEHGLVNHNLWILEGRK